MKIPSVGDLLFSAQLGGWPQVTAAGVTVGPGEKAWRSRVEAMDDDMRLRFWEARGGSPAAKEKRAGAHIAPRSVDVDDTVLGPSAEEFGTLVRAVMAAQRAGLVVPPDTYRVVWFDNWEGDTGMAVGITARFSEGPMEVWLQRGLTQVELFATVLHELKHVSDALDARYRGLSRTESERRANAFMFAVCWAELGVSPL
jgi:hypothetical protein